MPAQKIAYYMAYVMAFVFIVGETVRRGLGYFAINATTMLEDYLGGAFLLVAAVFWLKKHIIAPKLLVAAWAYSTGGMFVPFAAHLEAWLRGVTFRPDHPHEDIGSVIMKGIILAICLTCMILALRGGDAK